MGNRLNLVVAMTLVAPLLQYVDKNGNPYGLVVDLVSDLAIFLKKELKIVRVLFEELVPRLINREYDLIGILPIIPEREGIIETTIPYGKVGMDIVVRKNFVFKKIEDLNSPECRIIGFKNALSTMVAQKNFPLAQIISACDFNTASLDVVENKADVMMANAPIAFYYAQKKYPDFLTWHYLALDVHDVSFVLRKDKNQDLLHKINDFIKEYKNSGKMKILIDKHFGEMYQYLKKQGIEFGIKNPFS